MSIEKIAPMSHRVSIVSYIVGAKEVYIFLTMKCPTENLKKNIYCHFAFEHDIEKNSGCSRINSHWKKLFKNLKKILYPLFINEMSS